MANSSATLSAILAVSLGFLSTLACAGSDEPSLRISPDWNKTLGVSKAAVTIQVCVEPPLRRSQPLHDLLFKALRDLGADEARFQPWFPYPKMAIAELRPPSTTQTYWEFAVLDPIAEDFMRASTSHPVVFAFGTAPRWMFTTDTPTRYPDNPNDIDWTYNSDRQFNDLTPQLFADYQARLAAWYINGGFKDEIGQWHSSGHHYKIDYWEVMNEPDTEENLTPEQYVRIYDAVVEAVRKVAPGLKFVGPQLGDATARPDFLIYFLDRKHHQPGIPVDMLTYHFYSKADADETPEVMQHTIFVHADKFLTAARYIDAIRKRLSPTTLTDVEELGSMLPDPTAPQLTTPIPKSYWNLAGALWAYVYGNLAALGVNVVGAAELIDYPGQAAATTLVDWNTGEPNARYGVAKLLHDNFLPGDKIVAPPVNDSLTDLGVADEMIYAQAFVSPRGVRKLLLVNKRDRLATITVPGAAGGVQQRVDQSFPTSFGKWPITRDTFELPGLAVAVVTLPTRIAD